VRILRFYLPLSALFTAFFYLVYGGASWLSGYRNPPPAPHFAFEAAIPFVPWMGWVYLSVPLALALTPLVLRTKRELVPFFFTLTAQLLVAGIIYLIYPVAPAWPPRVAEGAGAAIFRVADVVNLDYNELPSLHLAFAVTVALVFGRRWGSMGRLLLWIWVLAVAASTLMLHEHHFLDVVTGTALGILMVATVQRRTEREAFLDALRLEVLCLRELAWFTRRHPRYLLTGLAIWSYSLRRWRATRLLRTGFCLAQHIDDVLDGDRSISGDPIAYARGLLRGDPGPLAPLASFVLEELEQRGGREKLEELVEVLIEDRRRMDARRTMPAAALAAHHRKTFQLSLDLTLLAAGSDLRAEDAPELVDALAWCSPVRDLEEDLAKGLINIPEEVLAQVPADSPILSAGPVQEWLRAEHRLGAEALTPGPSPASGRGVQSTDPGFRILAAFHRALAAYEKKYRRRHPDLVTGREGAPLSRLGVGRWERGRG
jgi:membrane-associated phospholipid phosphatase